MLVQGDQSCYDFPVIFVLIFVTHSTSLLFLFLNYFIQEYIRKKSSKKIEEKNDLKKINGYIKAGKHH